MGANIKGNRPSCRWPANSIPTLAMTMQTFQESASRRPRQRLERGRRNSRVYPCQPSFHATTTIAEDLTPSPMLKSQMARMTYPLHSLAVLTYHAVSHFGWKSWPEVRGDLTVTHAFSPVIHQLSNSLSCLTCYVIEIHQ